jgi:hypothetical protein
MRRWIEKFGLDVTKPRNLNPKNAAKASKEMNFETLLHVAAASCDAELIDWLLFRGNVRYLRNYLCYLHHIRRRSFSIGPIRSNSFPCRNIERKHVCCLSYDLTLPQYQEYRA